MSTACREPASSRIADVERAMTARQNLDRSARFQLEKPGSGPAAALRRDFGLTAAEARVAMALADGLGLDEICARQGVAMATTRSHLKSTFRKTNTKGQVQLVVLVFKLMRSS